MSDKNANAAPVSTTPPETFLVLEKLFQGIIGPLGATHIASLLVEPDHIEDRVNLLLKTFDQYPMFLDPFQALVKSLQGKSGEGAKLEEQIRFFNTKHTRYWLLVNLINSVLNVKDLKLDKQTGRLPSRPHDLLKFAHRARETFGEESRYKDLVFAAGLMFDFVFYLQRSHYLPLGQARFDDMIGQSFVRATEQGKRILALSKHKKELDLEELTPVTAYMRQLAQISIILIKMKEGVDFYKKMDTQRPPEPLKMALEMKAFGVHTGMISAYLAQSLPVFGKLGEVMSVWGFPYLSWVKGKQSIHDAAGMGMMGVAISERNLTSVSFGKTARPAGELPELQFLDFEITPQVKNEAKI